MITPDTVSKIFETARIDEVVGEFVKLKRRGVNLVGLCPFHDEKTPSFSVSPARGIYKCFGCGKGGNAVNFLMEHEHYTYPEALQYLAKKYNIEIEEKQLTEEDQKEQSEKEALFLLSSFAQKYFHEALIQSEEGKSVGLSYFKERGYNKETIIKFGLGYCPGKWDEFTNYALKNGYKRDHLLKTSLSKSKDHQLYDTFRGRVIFPIHNLSGRVLGFGARTLSADPKKPKYINSAESEIYHKSKILYGIYFAKSSIISNDNCYITEGYTDVISLHQAGIENVVASSGTSLTVDQIRLIRRYTNNITLLFDGDPAGVKAAFRGIDLILEQGLNIKLVLFPQGEDPDSYSRNNRPADVLDFVNKNANDFISFKTNLLLEETGDDPVKKAGLIKEIASTIALVPDNIARTLYIQRCSELMNIEEKWLFAEINKTRRQKFQKEKMKKSAEEQEMVETTFSDEKHEVDLQASESPEFKEKELVRIMLAYGNKEIMLDAVNEDNRPVTVPYNVLKILVEDIESENLEFETPVCRKIFEELKTTYYDQLEVSEQHFFNHDDENVRQLAIELLTSKYNLSANWENKQKIYVSSEEDNLKKIVFEVLYNFKLLKLDKMIYENQEKLKKEKDNEKIIDYIKVDKDLKEKRSHFANELSRVVLK